MNVLILDDREGGFAVGERVKLWEHVVLDCATITEAQSYWENRATQPVHCIIADLNMDPIGLAPELAQKSEGGLLAGWLWLESCVFSDEPRMRERTMVFSGYLTELCSLVDDSRRAGVTMEPRQGPGVDRAIDAFMERMESTCFDG